MSATDSTVHVNGRIGHGYYWIAKTMKTFKRRRGSSTDTETVHVMTMMTMSMTKMIQGQLNTTVMSLCDHGDAGSEQCDHGDSQESQKYSTESPTDNDKLSCTGVVKASYKKVLLQWRSYVHVDLRRAVWVTSGNIFLVISFVPNTPIVIINYFISRQAASLKTRYAVFTCTVTMVTNAMVTVSLKAHHSIIICGVINRQTCSCVHRSSYCGPSTMDHSVFQSVG